jgi:predicted Zn-dependent protease with MMP-like domain
MGSYSRSGQRISLYLHAIQEHCQTEGLEYIRELETTYLHELGHHLGLEEADLDKRRL